MMEVCANHITTQEQLRLEERKLEVLQHHPSLFPITFEHVLVAGKRTQDWLVVIARELTSKPSDPVIDKAILELV